MSKKRAPGDGRLSFLATASAVKALEVMWASRDSQGPFHCLSIGE